MLSKEENIQYSRHLLLDQIGEQGQLLLKKAKVLSIGAGGLGCPVLQYLTAAGVGTIGIIDPDTIDQTNLQRQILYTQNDIGTFKSETAAKRLSELNPYVQFNTYTEALTKDNALSIIEDYDIVVDGSDNFQTRYLVNDACVILKKPLVFGSIFKFEGQVSVFNFKGGPTYRCLFPSPPEANAVPNCSEVGVLGVLPGIIGSFQANEVIKIICGLEGVLSGILIRMNTLSMDMMRLKFQKNESINITSLADDYEHFCNISLVKQLTYDVYQKNKSAYFLLDVRTNEEREIVHLGGLHIPLSSLDSRIKEIDTDKPILVYCKSGIRSKKAIETLTGKLSNSFFNLKGGLIGNSQYI